LQAKGVDQVLAYVATQGPGIPEKVKTRAAEVREKNRSDLLPLFKSAQLEAERNKPAEAKRLFEEMPRWSRSEPNRVCLTRAGLSEACGVPILKHNTHVVVNKEVKKSTC
jgi:hypothetical protein